MTPTGPPDVPAPAIPISTGIAVAVPVHVPPISLVVPKDQRVSLIAYRKITVLSDNHAKTVCISILNEV